MNKETAEQIIKLSNEAFAETWFKRTPSAAMKEYMGTSARPIIEMPRPGKAYGQTVLAEDYEGNEELETAHIDFVTLAAKHAKELAQFYLEKNK